MRSLIIITATILFTACHKQDKVPVPVTTPKQASVERFAPFTDVTSPANPQNPYDSIGILHNILLDSVFSYVQRTGDTSRAGKHSQIIRYFKERSGLDVAEGMRRTSALIKAEFVEGKEAECLSKYLRPEALHYILKVLNLLKDVKDDKDCMSFKPAVMAIEQEVLAARKLTDSERMKILMVTSVVRHSFWYWKEAVLGVRQDEPMKDLFGFFKNLVKFLAFSHMDAIGVIYGLFPYEGMEQLGATAAGESAGAAWYIDVWL